MNTKKDIIQKHKYQNWKLSTPRNRYNVHNELTPRKSVPGYFKDVKTEETFSSQDQKIVETTNLWQLYWDKITPSRIRLCNNRNTSRIEYMNKNEQIKKTMSVSHCDQTWKNA